MKLRSVLTYSGLLILAAQSAAASDTVQLSVDTFLGYGYSDVVNKSMQETFRLAPRVDVEFSEQTRIVLEGRLRIDFADRLEPGEVNVDTYSKLSRPAILNDLGTAEIRDAYLERKLTNGILRIGKQQIVWGKLDGVKVLDILNPQDLREFIIEDFGESRIGLWSVYVDASLAGWRTELAIIPDNTGHAIPATGAWFELTAPRFRFGASPDDPGLPTETRRGSVGADTGAYALKISRFFGALEVGAMAYSGVDHEPLGRLASRNGQTFVERYYERREVFGLSAETAIGSVALRAEVAFQPGRKFNTRTTNSLSTTSLEQVRAGFGMDVSGPWDTFINIQYLYDNVRAAPDSLVRPETDHIATVFLRRNFSYDTVKLTAKWYRHLDVGDSMYSLALGFALGGNTELEVAAEAFNGTPTGIFGQFSDRDRITVELMHTF